MAAKRTSPRSLAGRRAPDGNEAVRPQALLMRSVKLTVVVLALAVGGIAVTALITQGGQEASFGYDGFD